MALGLKAVIPKVIEMEGAEKVTAALERLMGYRLMGEKQLRKILRVHANKIRKSISDTYHFENGDPRKAAQAVKAIIYKQLIGFNVNLYNPKRAGKTKAKTINRKSREGVGGNRRTRSWRTIDVDSYYGKDRAFILRFQEDGTSDRSIKFKNDGNRAKINRGSRGGDKSKYGKTINTGNRGHITGDKHFNSDARKAIRGQMEDIRNDIMKLIEEVWAEKETI